ncbi:MAG: class I SAM-dependent methyltransferase [Gammaproteobacteria bacterium]|nr:class I SAM-dependent methyltransferase [Gammaproteobacteria bacterium]
MKATRHSSTAEATAAVRAWHRLNHTPLIFDDPYALAFTSKPWRVICHNKLLTWLIFERVLKKLQPVAAEIICRSRYTEDKLESAIQNGIDQYVLLGAGFDSFVLRRPDLLEKIRIYEVDHPLSQRVKKERIQLQSDSIPSNLEFVPIDFEKETLPDALRESGYDSERPAFFSWLGVVQYLPRAAVFVTLESLASTVAAGSELVFDYLVPEEELQGPDRRVLEGLKRFSETAW